MENAVKGLHEVAIRSFNRQLLIFLVIPLVIGLVYVAYRSVQNARISSYFSQVDEIQKDANLKMTELNSVISQFQLNPSVASQVLPKFDEAKTVMDDSAARLEAIQPPGDDQATYHQDLIRLYRDSASLSGDLAAQAGYIHERDSLLKALSGSLDQFNNTVNNSNGDDSAVIDAAAGLRNTSDGSITGLQKLQSPLPIYSSEQLKQNLADLSQTLATLEAAVAARDSNSIRVAAQQLQELFARDWYATLVQLDSEGVKSYKSRIDGLRALQEEIVAERARLS